MDTWGVDKRMSRFKLIGWVLRVYSRRQGKDMSGTEHHEAQHSPQSGGRGTATVPALSTGLKSQVTGDKARPRGLC